jgi:hypothetical protein
MSHDNLTEDHERALAYAKYIRDTFGVDGTGYEPMDAPTANTRSTAQRHVQERNDALAQLQAEDRAAQLAVATGLEQDRAAYERVTSGASTTDADQRAALRHGHRHNLIPKQTSAEKLVAQSDRARSTT